MPHALACIGNDIIVIYCNVFIDAMIAVCWPLPLYLSENCDVKGLELVGAFWGESKDEDVMLICKHTKVVSFVRVVAIEEEEDRVII
jgi:hypothetical protein